MNVVSILRARWEGGYALEVLRVGRCAGYVWPGWWAVDIGVTTLRGPASTRAEGKARVEQLLEDLA